MANQSNYPELTYPEVYKLYEIARGIKNDKNYLKYSPYSGPIKDALEQMFQLVEDSPLSPTKSVIEDTADTSLNLEHEIKALYLDTKATLKSEALDDKERASVQRTAAAQLEKLLDMAERSRNLRWFREYETKVVKVLKKVLPAEREAFIKELVESEVDGK